MSMPRELTRQDVMPLVFCEVRKVRDAIRRLCSIIYNIDYEPPETEMSDETIDHIHEDWEEAYQACRHLDTVRSSNLFLSLEIEHGDPGFHPELEQALETMPIYLSDLELDLADADEGSALLGHLDESLDYYCKYQAISAYGQWGAHWFFMAMETLTDDEIRTTGDGIADLTPEQIVSALKKNAASEDADDIRDEALSWMYELAMQGVPYPHILRQLKRKPPTWPRYSSENGLKNAILMWAIRKKLPEPEPRRPGRPPGS